MKKAFHGSDIEAVAAAYHLDPEKILNFSSNVSPLGVPESAKEALTAHADCITRYPDRGYATLREAIGAYAETAAAHVLPGNGASELISLVIGTVRPRHVVIVGPTYSEYANAVARCGGHAEDFFLRAEDDFSLDLAALCARLDDGADMLILCNPNNPTSTAIWRDSLEELLTYCGRRDIRVLIDETYVEFAPDPADVSAVPLAAAHPNLVVIRGTSKFFAAPGLRLGYLVAGDPDLLGALRNRQDPWTVSAPADVAGRAMFADRAYIARAGEYMNAERERIFRELDTWEGIRAFRPEANFILLELREGAPDAQTVFDACLRDGMMIRNCSTFPTLEDRYIRFCFLRPEENDRLLATLRREIKVH